jgi:putative endopeptidase
MMPGSVHPGDDFYEFVNGDWIRSHPVPLDKSSFDMFTELNDMTEENLHQIVEEIASDTRTAESPGARKIGVFYRTGMDTVRIEEQGLQPLETTFTRIDSLEDPADIPEIIAWLTFSGIDPLFEIFAEIDAKNSRMMITGLSQGGLGLPNREYYLKEDRESADVRNRYQAHIATMMGLCGDSDDAARAAAHSIMQMEMQLATVSLTPEENRDPALTYHKMNFGDIHQITPEIAWDTFLHRIGYPAITELNLHQPRFFKEVSRMLRSQPIKDWKMFLRWKVINQLAPFLESHLEQENFNFYGRILNGQPEMKPRWKRVLGSLDIALGEALGRFYVEKYFTKDLKDQALQLVHNLQLSFRSRIESLTWMSPVTRKEALEKLSLMDFKIGYPDKWQDLCDLEVGTDSYVLNVLRAMQYDLTQGPLGLDKAGKPVDPDIWYMHPHTVNAYYDQGRNEFICPAAILQPPFFSRNAEDSANYGAIGAVIGHEMTHGFDDMGRKYDKEGNLREWWTPEDEKEFMQRAQTIVDQFNAFEVLPSLHANGQLTLGENIADLGGLTVAYHAFVNLLEGHKNAHVPNHDADIRRFFISYAKCWRESIRKEALRNRILSDEHAPNRLRVNGPLFNMPEFYRAFPEIKKGDALYRPPEKRPVIW